LGSPLATLSSAPFVLKAYESVRKSRGDRVILNSREACQIFESVGEYEGASDATLVEGINRVCRWLWEDNGDPDDDVAHALDSMKQAIAVGDK